MLPVIFNPYPSPIKDIRQIPVVVSLCSDKLKYLSEKVDIEGYVGIENDSFNKWIVGCVNDVCLTIPQLLNNFQGISRDKIKLLLAIFSRGKAIPEESSDELSLSVLKHIDVPASNILYAQKNDGVVLTISDDVDWNIDFFELSHNSSKILNIHDTIEHTLIDSWIQNWKIRHVNFIERIQIAFNLIFCNGALNTLPPECYYTDIENLFNFAHNTNYKVNNKTIKAISSNNLNLLELRNVSSGLRIFVYLTNNTPYVGGFYIKSQAISQNKAISIASKKIKMERLLE